VDSRSAQTAPLAKSGTQLNALISIAALESTGIFLSFSRSN
jgi:hypothetical protein